MLIVCPEADALSKNPNPLDPYQYERPRVSDQKNSGFGGKKTHPDARARSFFVLAVWRPRRWSWWGRALVEGTAPDRHEGRLSVGQISAGVMPSTAARSALKARNVRLKRVP